jgi:predicted nuclease of restriction endonuclease-like (RecB) superfamily
MHIKTTYRFQNRQLKARRFGCAVRQAAKVSPVARLLHPTALSEFQDAYMLEFLGLQGDHSESDLHQGLLAKLKAFLGELGRNFCFVGSQFPVQVGGRDFALDLLFFYRSLNCLVAIEPPRKPRHRRAAVRQQNTSSFKFGAVVVRKQKRRLLFLFSTNPRRSVRASIAYFD